VVLVIDNYDSFTYNLVQYLGELGAMVEVVRNDAMTVADVRGRAPSHILLSPGPGHPANAGITEPVIRELGGQIPILGVCLGHQALGEAAGGRVVRAPVLMHGKTSPIHHTGVGVFAGLPQPFDATRYHSLIVERESLPEALDVTAWTADGLVMGLRHKTLARLEGVQFHPESIMTAVGHRLLENFLRGSSLAAAA
jgi:anthranilate synthase component 2